MSLLEINSGIHAGGKRTLITQYPFHFIGVGTGETPENIQEAVTRLAAYEDSGLKPEEFQKLNESYNKVLDAFCDFVETVAKAVLGKQVESEFIRYQREAKRLPEICSYRPCIFDLPPTKYIEAWQELINEHCPTICPKWKEKWAGKEEKEE